LRNVTVVFCISLLACWALGGLGYTFDSTRGYPGEGPDQQVCACECFAFLSLTLWLRQEIAEQISILKQLRASKLGTGEAVYVESIGNKAHLSLETVKQRLVDLGFQSKPHGRWPAITIPATAVLDAKLSALGVDTTLLKPMSARFNGYYHKIDAITGCEPCRNHSLGRDPKLLLCLNVERNVCATRVCERTKYLFREMQTALDM